MAKILMISGDRSLAGSKRGAFYNTLEEFHKYWERLDIICPRTKALVSNSQTPNVKNIFRNVFLHPSPWPLVFQPFWILKKGLEIFREQKFNLMTIHEYPPFYNGIGARLLWNKIKIPYVLEIHHIVGYPKAADLKEKFYKFLTKLFIKEDSKKAIALRVVNKQVKENLIKWGVKENKIKLIPSFYIDLDIFKPLNFEKKYDLVTACRLVKNKGLDLLLEAIKLIAYDLKPKLLIIGEGPEFKNLKAKVKSLKLENNVEFAGWLRRREEIAQLFNQSKIFILTSYNEGGPRAALEAIACGLPIITTRVGIIEEIIKDGKNGIFIDWSQEDIAEKIKFLLENNSLQEKFAKTNLTAIKQFEKKSAVKNYAQSLLSLIPH